MASTNQFGGGRLGMAKALHLARADAGRNMGMSKHTTDPLTRSTEPARRRWRTGSAQRALFAAAACGLTFACSGDHDPSVVSGSGGSAASSSSGGSSDAGSSNTGGAQTGSGGSFVPIGSGGDTAGSGPTDGGFEACTGVAYMQTETPTPLDIYFIFDRTGSMGTDCAYTHGMAPPVASKACFATYALSDYLIDENPMVDTRLAFHQRVQLATLEYQEIGAGERRHGG